MGATNDRRVSRAPEELPDYSRDDTVKSAIDNLFEEDTGMGYSEITYITNVFVTKIETYVDVTKTQLRSRTDFTYAPLPFVGTVVKKFFKEDGTTELFRITAVFSYNANKTVNNIDVQTQRF